MYTNKFTYLFLIALTLISCRDPFDAETEDFISALVVEATLTNELKHQKVLLSSTYVLEENEATTLNNATVWVEDELNNNYTFSQDADGNYLSDIAFQAIPENQYTLYITTSAGKNYQSSPNTLTPISQIDDLYAELITEDDQVAVMVDSNNSNNARYFRYEYEETYKVIVPHHYDEDLLFDNLVEIPFGLEYDISIVPREQEERVCYTTKNSIGIIQTSTSELDANFVSRFPVKLISQESSVLTERYSILVKQYVQNLEAYTYYKVINELGGLENVLSENQPGYVLGNIQNVANSNEKVLGYFEVASVTEKRIYFNYQDFNLPTPPWFYECEILVYDYNAVPDSGSGDINERRLLYSAVQNLGYKLLSYNNLETVFTIVNINCGDCTSFSSNMVPDFWEE